MKRNKFLFVLLLLISISAVATGSTFLYLQFNNDESAENDILIMTSCNPVYIATMNVVGDVDGVTVQNLSQPTTGCLHDYTLTTEDMKSLSYADVLVVNGNGMEGYLNDVISAYPELPLIDSSVGITEENSHLWMSDELYVMQIQQIANSLALIDDENAEAYAANATAYINEIETTLDKSEAEALLSGSNVAVLHAAFELTADSIGANTVLTLDLDEERQVSAGEVRELINTINDENVPIVFAEYDYGHEIGELIEEQTDARVVYLETLVHGEYDKDSYIEVMNSNYQNIVDVLGEQ